MPSLLMPSKSVWSLSQTGAPLLDMGTCVKSMWLRGATQAAQANVHAPVFRVSLNRKDIRHGGFAPNPALSAREPWLGCARVSKNATPKNGDIPVNMEQMY